MLYNALLLVHVLGGFLGLASAFVPLLGAKGGAAHRQWGRVFVWAMGTAALTAIPLAIWRRDPLQGLVGIFSGYLALYGLRILRRGKSGRLAVWEKGLGAFAFAAFAAGAGWALLSWRDDAPSARSALLFAGLGGIIALADVSSWVRADRSSRARVGNHMMAMVLALAGGWAAFLNTQGDRLFRIDGNVAIWMIPPVLAALAGVFIAMPRRVRAMRRGTLTPDGDAGTPVRTLRTLGLIEGLSFLLLLLIAVPAKRFGGDPTLVRILGPIHGSLVLMYLVAGVWFARSASWPLKRYLALLLAASLPLGTFVFDGFLKREEAKV